MKFGRNNPPLSREQRVEIFMHIRNEPYCINYLNPWQDLSAMGKAQWFRDQLAFFSMDVRLIYCQFRWDTTLVPRALYEKTMIPFSWHVYPEVRIPETGRWIAADPTLDGGLKDAGFPVAEWDGLNPTILAVQPFRVFSPQHSKRIVDEAWDEIIRHPAKMHEQFGSFANAINDWISRQRSKPDMPYA